MKGLLIIFTFLLVLIPNITKAEQHKFKIAVYVHGSRDAINLVQSYLKRELRSIGDVVVDYEDVSYVLNVVVIEDKTQSGIKRGYVISVVELSPYKIKILNDFLSMAGLNPKEKRFDSLKDSFTETYQFRDHFVQIGPERSLKNICEEIVARFDTSTLEPARKFWRNLGKQKDVPNK